LTLSSTKSNVICDECKNWVAKARDIVQNNDVDIVRNLEAICHYIPIRQWENSCVKIAEEDAASVIKMIESKMDPDAVCSNIFLCNNDELISPLDIPKKSPPKCSQCNAVAKLLEDNWTNSNQDFVLERMLGVCGELSSYSDSCTTIVMTYFDDIYSFMRKNMKAKEVCSYSCSTQKKSGIVDIVPAFDDTSITCELCQQLFVHLSEVLLINTSEIEFRNMLLGFCHEMGNFNSQCVSIVDEYHETIYEFLKDNLNANKTCVAAGICKVEKSNFAMPRQPLLLNEMYPLPKTVVEMKLDPSLNLKKNGTLCATCESFIHLIHEVLEKQTFDDEILNETKKLCSRLPENIRPECLSMVDLYGDAVIALWSQSMNPNEICPMLKLCPPILSLDYLQKTSITEKPTCPFCLMAMQDIKDYISSNNTKENIESALSRLCTHLSNKLLSQCTEFVKTYSSEVVDMLIADFTPQEACTFIKLCTEDKDHDHPIVKIQDEEVIGNPQCQLCKEVVKIVEQRVINKKSKVSFKYSLKVS
jgi:saposin